MDVIRMAAGILSGAFVGLMVGMLGLALWVTMTDWLDEHQRR